MLLYLVVLLWSSLVASWDLPLHEESRQKNRLDDMEIQNTELLQLPEHLKSMKLRIPSARRLGPAFLPDVLSPTIEQRCAVAVDLVVLVDNTTPRTDSVYNSLIHRLEEMMLEIIGSYFEAKIALAVFEDHPIVPLGKAGDLCYNDVKGFDDDVFAIINALGDVPEGNQNDDPESQYTALYSAAINNHLQWRGDTIVGGPNEGFQVAKIILIITDAPPHFDGDGLSWGLETPSSPPTFPYQCGKFDYPSFTMIRDALHDRKAIPAFFAGKNPEGSIYQEFIDAVMDGHGSVTSKAAVADVAHQILNAVDGALEVWCKDYYVEPPSTSPEPTEPTTTTSTSPEPTDAICAQKDILFVRDLSSSTIEDIIKMRKYVGDYVDRAPEGSQFALVSHSDKPVEPFGYTISMDYCFWVHSDLTNKEDFILAYEDADSDHRSGGDFRENQLDAVIKGLREIGMTQQDEECNCVVILSDAFYHEAGDYERPAYNPDGNECEEEDYPSIQQVADQLIANNVGCFTIATVQAVVPFWEDFRMDMMYAGYEGTIEIEIIPDPKRRKLSEIVFGSQQKIDLRHLQSRL